MLPREIDSFDGHVFAVVLKKCSSTGLEKQTGADRLSCSITGMSDACQPGISRLSAGAI